MNLSALLGKAVLTEKKPAKYKLENIEAANIVASIYWRSASIHIPNDTADFFHSLWGQQFAAFCLFVRTLPIGFALLGRKRKDIKSKTRSKLRGKRTSIAAVRDILWTFGTFPTPLLSHYRLPLWNPNTILKNRREWCEEKKNSWYVQSNQPATHSSYCIIHNKHK